jgi:predicted secreted protein
MTKRAGSQFILQVESSPNVWESIPGERVSGYTIGNESVDTTAKSQTSRELSACGVKTVSITASGIKKDDLSKTLWNFLNQLFFSGSIARFQVLSGLDHRVVGSYLVSSFNRTGEYNGAEQWSLTLESADVVVQETAPPIPLPPLAQYHGSVMFSVRRLVFQSSYSGPCLRLRRSSDNAELDIPFNSDGWLDEAVATAFVGAGDGFVTAWYNQTPQYGITKFVQPDATKQPRLITSGVIYKVGASQRPCLRFDGTRWLRTETQNVLKVLGIFGTVHMQCVEFLDVGYMDEQVIFEQHESGGGYGVQMLAQRYRTHEATEARASVGWIFSSAYVSHYYTPSPPVANVFAAYGVNANTSSIKMFYRGTTIGEGVSNITYPPGATLFPTTDPATYSRTFHSYIGCNRFQAKNVSFGLQEFIAQSVSWTDQQTSDMLANEQGAFL